MPREMRNRRLVETSPSVDIDSVEYVIVFLCVWTGCVCSLVLTSGSEKQAAVGREREPAEK